MANRSQPTLLWHARNAAGKSQGDVRRELVAARRRRGQMPPKAESLKRMYTEWEQGRVFPAEWVDELCEVFGQEPAALGLLAAPTALDVQITDDGSTSLLAVSALESADIELIESQTDQYRRMDRRFGAAVIPQLLGHVQHIESVLNNSMPGAMQERAGAALSEAAALAGWLCLNKGDPRQCWDLHNTAKLAARLSGDPATLAHVTAQQCYALLDTGRPREAAELAQLAQQQAGTLPPRLRAWLLAVEGECWAQCGDAEAALRSFDAARAALPDGSTDQDPELPYLMLNEAHLARWRGNALVLLGVDDAIDDLTTALQNLDGTSLRAATGMHVDLALALHKRGDAAGSRTHAEQASKLAEKGGSARQRVRLRQILN